MPWPSIDLAAIRRIPWGSLRIRLTLLNTAAVLLAMFILILAVRLGVRSALFRDTDATLMAEVREIALTLDEAALLHPVDDPGGARLGDVERLGERHPAELGPQRRGAEGEDRDVETGAAERARFHAAISLSGKETCRRSPGDVGSPRLRTIPHRRSRRRGPRGS